MANAYSITDLFTVHHREITSVLSTALTAPITTYLTQPCYAAIRSTTLLPTVVDVNKMILTLSDIDLTQSYQSFLSTYLVSDLVVATYTVADFPQIDPTTKKYPYRVDVFNPHARSGYVVSYGNQQTPTDLNNAYTRGSCNDLVITYTGEGPSPIWQNILASVNGVFHQTTVIGDALFIIDGFENYRQCGLIDIVLMDTTSVGGHSVIPITTSMVVSSDPTYASSVYIKLPSTTSLINQSVLLCLDGYLSVFNPATYRVINDHTLKIHTCTLDLIGNFINNPNMRYTNDIYRMLNRISPLDPNSVTPVNNPPYTDANDPYFSMFTQNTQVPAHLLQSPEFIRARLTSLHSFLVVIHNPDIYTKTYNLIDQEDVKRLTYTGSDTPRGLLLYGRGKAYPYTIMQSKQGSSMIYLQNIETTMDLYKTVPLNKVTDYPSARTDGQELKNKSAKIIELYTNLPH